MGALLGVVAAAAGLAVAELLSGIFHQRVSPVVAVAESIIRLTPGDVVEFVISLVGQYDKPLLVVFTLLGLAAVSAGVGVVAIRSTLGAQGLFVLMGVVVVLAVRARLTPSMSTYIPAVLGVVVAMAALAVLAPRAAVAANRTTATQPADTRRSSRRDFLRLTGVVAAAAVMVGVTGRVLAQGRAALEAARGQLKLPIRRRPTPPGADLAVTGLAPWVTDQDDFYRIDTALSVPQILPGEWELRIHGLVDREMTLTYQDLIDRGLTEAWVTLCCVSNQVGGGLISNASWSGVPIADVLAEAGVHDDADAVLSTSADDWTCGTPLSVLTDDRNALFAVAMNGEPLTAEHGFPVRMVVPGLYGYVSATKWVVDFEVTRFADFTAFWTDRGWAAEGPIKTQSRIDVPGDGSSFAAGDVVVAGVAWAQHTGIAKVEVRIADQPWVEASLADEPTIDSWRQWSYVWPAQPGSQRIQVRATDQSGETQTEAIADVLPDGATGWHTITVDVG